MQWISRVYDSWCFVAWFGNPKWPQKDRVLVRIHIHSKCRRGLPNSSSLDITPPPHPPPPFQWVPQEPRRKSLEHSGIYLSLRAHVCHGADLVLLSPGPTAIMTSVCHPQQQRREKELRKQQEREQRRHYEEQMRREEERRRAEHEQVRGGGKRAPSGPRGNCSTRDFWDVEPTSLQELF